MENKQPMIDQFISEHKLSNAFIATARDYYIPLAERIALHHKEANKPFYVGLNGCQGSGKSTLGDFLAKYLHQICHLKVVILSLDDFYLDQQQRQQLAQHIHPLFKTRGVPGTHNTQLMQGVLTDLATKGGTVALPKFNKALDDPYPDSQWRSIVAPVDIVILEGWCWGVEAQSSTEVNRPVNALESLEDPDGIWRTYVNQQLQTCYQPLYKLMNYWVMLKAPDFSHVFAWRLEQEQKLASTLNVTDQLKLMNAAQIERFIQFYQRLTQHGLTTLAQHCDEVFELDPKRKIIRHIVSEQTKRAAC